MQIKSVKLQNWRSHLKTEFTFGRINLIRGPNNSGKSGLAGAIEYVLTGRMAGTDERGSGTEKWLTLGVKAKEATIEAQIAANNGLQLTLKRSRTASGSTVTASDGGFTVIGKQVDEFLEEKGYGRDLLSASLRVGRFLSLSADARRELLADLLAPPGIEIPAEMVLPIDLVLQNAIHGKQSLEAIRKLEDSAIKVRAACTAALREIGEPAEIKPPDPETPTAVQCQKRLDALRFEQGAIIKQKEKVIADWQAAVNRRADAEKQLPITLELILDKPAETVLLDTIAKETQINEATSTLSRLRFEIAELEAQIKTAEKKAGKCPTCGHEVETEELLTRYRDGISARQSRIPTLEGIVGAHEPIHVARAKLSEHREAIVVADKLKAIIAVEVPMEPDTATFDVKIAELEDRIQRGQAILTEIAKHEVTYRDYIATVEKRKTLEARREAADKVAKWAGPGGVQSSITGDKFGAFSVAINEVLHVLGYDLQMTADGWMLVGEFPIGQQKSPEHLSESEQWRFSVALQIAIAKVTGIGIVLLDRADVLVGENRSKLIEVARATDVQVFIFASVEEVPYEAPDWLTVFELRLDKEGHTIVKGKK